MEEVIIYYNSLLEYLGMMVRQGKAMAGVKYSKGESTLSKHAAQNSTTTQS